MGRGTLFLLSALALCAALQPGAADAAAYALAPVRGPKGSAPREVERAILDRLETRGDEAHLGDPRPGERQLAVKIKKRGRVFNVELSLTESSGGAPTARRVGTYHPRRGVSSSIAVLLDRLLDGLAEPTEVGDEESDEASEPETEAPEAESDAELVSSEEDAPADDAEAHVEEAASTPPPVSAETPHESAPAKGGRLGLEIGLGLGTQLLTRYTVSVDGSPTALAYRASPLFLIAPSLRFQAPDGPIWIALRGELAQVGFEPSTQPPLTPEVARGAFLGLGLEAGWTFELGSGLSLAPLAALRLERLGVDEQSALLPGPGGEPMPVASDVVLSALAVVPELGVLGRYAATAALSFTLEARLRLLASYSESPTNTGAAGPGFGVAFGGGLGYLLTDWLLVELQVRYQYSAVSFSGAATRVPFAEGPPLVDASLAYEDLKLSLGPVLRL